MKMVMLSRSIISEINAIFETHLAYRTNAKKVLKVRVTCVLADVIRYWKMTSYMALDCVTSFLRWKDVTNACKRMRRSLSIGGSSSVQWGKLEKAEDFKCVFAIYCVLESK